MSKNPRRFSALQRAENSSRFCRDCELSLRRGFSALQRAENSSISPPQTHRREVAVVSVLFSEPKIPHSAAPRAAFAASAVSVLFSEPKIPHIRIRIRRIRIRIVSVLFSEPKIPHVVVCERNRYSLKFQCSSASRKFLNRSGEGR